MVLLFVRANNFCRVKTVLWLVPSPHPAEKDQRSVISFFLVPFDFLPFPVPLWRALHTDASFWRVWMLSAFTHFLRSLTRSCHPWSLDVIELGKEYSENS